MKKIWTILIFFIDLNRTKKIQYSGGKMIEIKKTDFDLLDDIYSLAWWMTGNEKESQDLVSSTYLYAGPNIKQSDVLKKFRACYLDKFGQYTDFCISEPLCKTHLQLIDSLKEWAADIKLSVLLCEISGLQHRQIAEIVEKPLDTVRIWLLWGRQLLVNNCQLKASA